MSKQIAVRLSDELVEFVDELVGAGTEPSRAAVVTPHMTAVTIAPITTTVRGLSTEVAVDAANGISAPSVVSCDNITTIPTSALGEQIGTLLDRQEQDLSDAIRAAFDLD